MDSIAGAIWFLAMMVLMSSFHNCMGTDRITRAIRSINAECHCDCR